MSEIQKSLETFASLTPEEQRRALEAIGVPRQQKRPQAAPKATPIDSLKSQSGRKRRPPLTWV